MEDLSVVVGICGTYWEESENLARTIENHGFHVERVPVPWPRDLYVYCDGNYIKGPAGEGGCVHVGNGCLIVSENIFPDGYTKEVNAESEMQRYYPNRKIRIMPVGYNPAEAKMIESCKVVEHIDMTCLLIPSRDLLLVDQSFYRRDPCNYGDNPKRKIAEIAEEERLRLEYYNPHSGSSYRYFPMNCLVLPWDKDEEIVFANSNVKPFLRMLNKHDLKFVEVDFKETPKKMGSIRCCTNVKERSKPLESLIPK